jgi:hypothetical protein
MKKLYSILGSCLLLIAIFLLTGCGKIMTSQSPQIQLGYISYDTPPGTGVSPAAFIKISSGTVINLSHITYGDGNLTGYIETITTDTGETLKLKFSDFEYKNYQITKYKASLNDKVLTSPSADEFKNNKMEDGAIAFAPDFMERWLRLPPPPLPALPGVPQIPQTPVSIPPSIWMANSCQASNIESQFDVTGNMMNELSSQKVICTTPKMNFIAQYSDYSFDSSANPIAVSIHIENLPK